MPGPVEYALRRQLRAGEVISRSAAVREHGAGDGVILDGLVRRGIAEKNGDAISPKIRVIPEETIARVNARLREIPGTPPPTPASIAAAKRREQQRDELRRALDGAKTPEARALVMRRSRVSALADDVLADLATIDVPEDLSMFGIEIDGGTP